jgi:hypothetical protein
VQRQLSELVESLEKAQGRLRHLSDNISNAAWARRPRPKSWSAADCVEHLNMTSSAYLPLLRDASAEARQLGAPSSTRYRQDAIGWLLAQMIGPMRHIGKLRIGKVKTTSDFVPRGGKSADQLLSEFVRLQSDLITLIRSADALPLDRVKIVSPFGGRMKYNAYSALVIVARHQHRHIDQAEEASRG